MTVNKENNRRMMNIAILEIILTLVSIFVNPQNTFLLYYILLISTEIIYILLLRYIINILQFARENIAVQNPFSILLGLEVVRFLGILFFSHSTDALLSNIGLLIYLIFIYIAMVAFKINAKSLKWPFLCLGFSLVLVGFVRIIMIYFLTMQGKNLLIYSQLIGVIPFIPIIYIIKRTNYILSQNEMNNN